MTMRSPCALSLQHFDSRLEELLAMQAGGVVCRRPSKVQSFGGEFLTEMQTTLGQTWHTLPLCTSAYSRTRRCHSMPEPMFSQSRQPSDHLAVECCKPVEVPICFCRACWQFFP